MEARQPPPTPNDRKFAQHLSASSYTSSSQNKQTHINFACPVGWVGLVASVLRGLHHTFMACIRAGMDGEESATRTGIVQESLGKILQRRKTQEIYMIYCISLFK
jgi:hypothetical protein